MICIRYGGILVIRLKELKKQEYNPKFEELFYFLYSVDIDYIMDFEKYEKDGKLNVDIGIHGMKEKIRLMQFREKYEEYTIIVDYVEMNKENECTYQKVEYYTFKTISSLVEKLKELLSKLSDIIVIEYDKRPYKSIYNIVEHAKLELIADDSSWFKDGGIKTLSLTLADNKLNKIIFVSHEKHYDSGYYEISYHDYLEEEKQEGKKSYYDYFKKFKFKTEEELCNKLRELLEPCLRKRRVRKIGYKYDGILKAMAK